MKQEIKQLLNETGLDDNEVPINEIDSGFACCINDDGKKWIEINKHLKEFPELYKSTMAHEIQHFKSKNKHMDFMLDLKCMFNLRDQWEIFKFHRKYPKSFSDMSPFFYRKKWGVNWFVLLSYSAFLVILGGIIYLI